MKIGLEGCSYTRTLGMKKVTVSKKDSSLETPLKKMCSGGISINSDCFPLEALPQDVLVQVLCGVEHEDLKHLFHVSKTVREATLLAKKLHFQFNTPKKNKFTFLNRLEPPHAPLITRKTKPKIFLKEVGVHFTGLV